MRTRFLLGAALLLGLGLAGGASTAPPPLDVAPLQGRLDGCSSLPPYTAEQRACARALAIDLIKERSRVEGLGVTGRELEPLLDLRARAMELIFERGRLHPTPEELATDLERAAGAPPASLQGRRPAASARRSHSHAINCYSTAGMTSAAPKVRLTNRVECFYAEGGRSPMAYFQQFSRVWRLSGSWYAESTSWNPPFGGVTCYGLTGCIYFHTSVNGTGYFQGEAQAWSTPPPNYTGNRFSSDFSLVCYAVNGTIQYC